MKKCIIIFLSIPSLLFAQNKDNEVIVIKSDKQIEEFTSSLDKMS